MGKGTARNLSEAGIEDSGTGKGRITRNSGGLGKAGKETRIYILLPSSLENSSWLRELQKSAEVWGFIV